MKDSFEPITLSWRGSKLEIGEVECDGAFALVALPILVDDFHQMSNAEDIISHQDFKINKWYAKNHPKLKKERKLNQQAEQEEVTPKKIGFRGLIVGDRLHYSYDRNDVKWFVEEFEESGHIETIRSSFGEYAQTFSQCCNFLETLGGKPIKKVRLDMFYEGAPVEYLEPEEKATKAEIKMIKVNWLEDGAKCLYFGDSRTIVVGNNLTDIYRNPCGAVSINNAKFKKTTLNDLIVENNRVTNMTGGVLEDYKITHWKGGDQYKLETPMAAKDFFEHGIMVPVDLVEGAPPNQESDVANKNETAPQTNAQSISETYTNKEPTKPLENQSEPPNAPNIKKILDQIASVLKPFDRGKLKKHYGFARVVRSENYISIKRYLPFPKTIINFWVDPFGRGFSVTHEEYRHLERIDDFKKLVEEYVDLA